VALAHLPELQIFILVFNDLSYPGMKLERTLYQNGYLWFAGFFLFAIAGFWASYFLRLDDQENYRLHAHGIGLFLWCAMLTGQALLIRLGWRTIHRRLGMVSYVLVPYVLYSTYDLFVYTMGGARDMPARGYVFTAAVILALVLFALYYGLAIWFRRDKALHARFMVCTAFPLFTPITDRLIGRYLPELIPHLPSVEGPVLQAAGLALASLILAGLALWDWLSHRRRDVFLFAFAMELFYFFGVMKFHAYGWWRALSDWVTAGQ
jgi:hypothetical protein